MLERLKALALRLAKVPPEPHPPAGSPGSIRIFRAAPNYWKYLLVTWGIRQVAGGFAIAVFLSMTATWQAAANAPRPAAPQTAAGAAEAPASGDRAEARRPGKRRNRRPISVEWQRDVSGWIHSLELLGLGFFLVQMPFSLAATRLNYEMRWYIVTDRSLRLREGILRVREMTLTFANVQNIAIRQGPLQRLLGIADVVVRTAGGGGSTDAHSHESHAAGQSMHTGILRAVDNAGQVRDMILDRLRRLRDGGLGDPDDPRHPVSERAPGRSAELARDAARELLEEARALRAARS